MASSRGWITFKAFELFHNKCDHKRITCQLEKKSLNTTHQTEEFLLKVGGSLVKWLTASSRTTILIVSSLIIHQSSLQGTVFPFLHVRYNWSKSLRGVYSAKNNQTKTIWRAGMLLAHANENMFKVMNMEALHNFSGNYSWKKFDIELLSFCTLCSLDSSCSCPCVFNTAWFTEWPLQLFTWFQMVKIEHVCSSRVAACTLRGANTTLTAPY